MEISTVKPTSEDRQLLTNFMNDQCPEDIDFNWLMPVVAEINELCKETGYPDGLEICQWHIIAVSNNIKLVCYSVIEFIRWYNNQQSV